MCVCFLIVTVCVVVLWMDIRNLKHTWAKSRYPVVSFKLYNKWFTSFPCWSWYFTIFVCWITILNIVHIGPKIILLEYNVNFKNHQALLYDTFLWNSELSVTYLTLIKSFKFCPDSFGQPCQMLSTVFPLIKMPQGPEI